MKKLLLCVLALGCAAVLMACEWSAVPLPLEGDEPLPPSCLEVQPFRPLRHTVLQTDAEEDQIGRASCRERV